MVAVSGRTGARLTSKLDRKSGSDFEEAWWNVWAAKPIFTELSPDLDSSDLSSSRDPARPDSSLVTARERLCRQLTEAPSARLIPLVRV